MSCSKYYINAMREINTKDKLDLILDQNFEFEYGSLALPILHQIPLPLGSLITFDFKLSSKPIYNNLQV